MKTDKTTPPDKWGAAPCLVPLDPATCVALKPIHDIGNQAMKERDEWNRWSVGIARLLNVSCADFASDVVADQYAELRDRITQALNATSSATGGANQN
jgi:hypothetical protein